MAEKNVNESAIVTPVDRSDSSSPFFLHHADSPDIMLVSQLLTEDNYPTWSRAMIIALLAKNKLGSVDGTVTKPTNTPDLSLWERCNTMMLSWIWNAVSKEITNSVIYLKTAKDVWDDLKERYAPSNSIQIYNIKRAISMHVQNDISITSYYTILKGYWDELESLTCIPMCGCGIVKDYSQYQQREKVFQFLMGLNDSYATIKSQILTMDPLPNMNKVYSLVLQEEKQRGARIVATQPLELATMIVSVKETRQQGGGARARGRGRGSQSQERLRCDFCGYIGHVRDQCYKLHGYPTNKSNTKEKGTIGTNNFLQKATTATTSVNSVVPHLTPEQYNQLMSLLSTEPFVNLAGPVNEEDDWDG